MYGHRYQMLQLHAISVVSRFEPFFQKVRLSRIFLENDDIYFSLLDTFKTVLF